MKKSLGLLRKAFGLSLALIPLTFMLASAETATSDEMQKVCHNWLKYIIVQYGEWGGSNNPEITDAQDIVVDNILVGRCYSIDLVGYIVVPVLKHLPPVKAYSDENNLDLSETDGFPAMLKEILYGRTQQFIDAYGSLEALPTARDNSLFGEAHRLEWDNLMVEEKVFEAALSSEALLRSVTDVGPLLTTVWHQGDPYNQYCPFGDGDRCVVGCVATAAAQILAYHRWPLEGVGTYQYWWPGDFSCGGSTPGKILSAEFYDPYDWENIPDHCVTGCTLEQQAALAELNYEMGVAYNMQYGVCGSGAYTSQGQTILPNLFRYYNIIEKHDRNLSSMQMWSDLIRTEVEAGRPILYSIYSHAIVGDGWRMYNDLHQVHMNYGWGGGHNAWYTIDNLYCPWDGCDPSVESMLTKIAPDKRAYFTCDTSWGFVPFSVNFSGFSSMAAESWAWAFGDGDSAFIQAPSHTYMEPGRYDVSLKVTAGTESKTYLATMYITALADSLIGENVIGDPSTQVEMVVTGSNTVPLDYIRIPVDYSGSINLALDSFSTQGCRTDYFDQKRQNMADPLNRRAAFSLYNTSDATADLVAGSGPIIKLYFTIPGSATPEQGAIVAFDGFLTYWPEFRGPVMDYTPRLVSGSVSLPFDCGDLDGSAKTDMLDILFLIGYLYKYGPAPPLMKAADVNGDCSIDMLDIIHMLSYLYKSGPPLTCPGSWPCK